MVKKKTLAKKHILLNVHNVTKQMNNLDMGGDAEPCPPRLASWFSNASNLLPPLILVAGGLQADGRVALSGAAFVFLKWLQNLKESNGFRTMRGDAQPCR